ncbi:MAG: MATE family efflux transporter [Lachnospiraceae bacterium]|nr:MATE family efflux transporter [Lachnospiraceae bacterium]
MVSVLRRERRPRNFLEGVIWKQILSFFLPILAGSFFQQLYNMVDTVVIGHALGTNALASVGTTTSLISLLVELFVGVSGGASVVIAQYYGAREEEKVSKAVHTAVAFSLAGGLFLMVAGSLSAKPLLRLMQVPDEILDDAALYMQVYYAGAIGSLLYNMGTGILRSVGDSRTPLLILIVCCFVNIGLDLLFVLKFNWGIFGVAFATILSQYTSAILVMLILMRSGDCCRISLKKIRFHGPLLKQIIRIGLPNGLESASYSFSNVFVQTAINGFGTVAIAAWSAIARIDCVVWMVMSAYAISVSTMVGQNFGARQYDRLKKITRVGFWMNLGSIVVVSLGIYFFCPYLLAIFTEDKEVIETGCMFLRILATSYSLYVCISIFSCVIRGCGESLQPMIITLLFICGLRLVWMLALVPRYPSISFVALCYPATWLTTGTIFLIYYLRGRWLTRAIKRQEAA